jgi:hypothetical protein
MTKSDGAGALGPGFDGSKLHLCFLGGAGQFIMVRRSARRTQAIRMATVREERWDSAI